MTRDYEINQLAKEESWRLFRIMGELVEGFDTLSGCQPAVTIYGSARITPEHEMYKQTEEIAQRLGEMGFSIITGGGPGVMEAANKGAFKAGVPSIGLNIELPEEQVCNSYTTKSMTFHHFFARKVMLVKYATAFVILPGGMGTLDEMTEVLTLMQTHKIRPFPVILYSSKYWAGFMEWLRTSALTGGYISESDFNLVRICDAPEDVVEIVREWYTNHELTGRKVLGK